jgi:hypothetical protein
VFNQLLATARGGEEKEVGGRIGARKADNDEGRMRGNSSIN